MPVIPFFSVGYRCQASLVFMLTGQTSVLQAHDEARHAKFAGSI